MNKQLRQGRRKQGITEPQMKVLEFLVSFQASNNTSPSLQDIADHMELESTSSSGNYLNRLQVMGYIRSRKQGKHRVTTVTEKGQKLVDDPESPECHRCGKRRPGRFLPRNKGYECNVCLRMDLQQTDTGEITLSSWSPR